MAVSVGYCFALLGAIQLCLAESTTTSKPPTSSKSAPASGMINLGNLDVVDYLRSAALVVVFLFTLLSDKRGGRGRGRGANPWVNAEVVGLFIAGMAIYFFPETILQYFSKNKLNVWHQMDFQMGGGVLVGLAVTTARMQNSIESDGFVHSNWLMSRLFASGGLCCFMVLSHFTTSFFRDQNLTFCVLAVLVWLLSTLYQMFVSNKAPVSNGVTATSMNSGTNVCLLIETLISIPLSLPFLMDPSQFYNQFATGSTDSFNAYIARLVGILIITTSRQNFGALYYSDNDKKQLFFGKLVTMGMVLPVIVLSQWKHSALTPAGVWCSGIFTCISLLANWIGYNNGKIKVN